MAKLTSLLQVQVEKLQQVINQQPARQYYMAFALISLLIVKFVFVPWFEQVGQRKEQLQQLANTVKAPNLMLEQTERMQQALASKEELHAKWLGNFYQDSTSKVKVDLVNKLQASAKAKDLLFLRSRWLTTPKEKLDQYSTLEPLMYSVLIRGDYSKIRELIQQWQAYKPLVLIDEISVNDRRDPGVVATTFKITIFRLKQDEQENGVRS